MSVTSQWESLMAVLRGFAPMTAASFRPGASSAEIDAAEAALGVQFAVELREWFSVQNGQVNADDDYAGELLAQHQFFSLEQVITEHATLLSISNEMADANPDVYDNLAKMSVAAPEAGTATDLFIPPYVPISGAEDVDNFCDTRPGDASGCVSLWAYDGGPAGPPIWSSMSEMLAAIERNILVGPPDGWRIGVEGGVMHWEIAPEISDLSSQEITRVIALLDQMLAGGHRRRSPVPEPAPSQMNGGVDIIAAQREILELAARAYPNSVVTDVWLAGGYLPSWTSAAIHCCVEIANVRIVYTITATDMEGGYAITEDDRRTVVAIASESPQPLRFPRRVGTNS